MGCIKEQVPPFTAMKATALPSTSAVIPVDALKLGLKRNRRVSFREDAQVETIPEMSQKEQEEVWYTNDELNEFKDNAKLLCQRLFLEDPEKILNQRVSCCHGGGCIRGMERYICPDRHKHKCLAVRVILKAHERCSSPEHLALIAQKCTFQSKQVAYVAAIRDASTALNILKADKISNVGCSIDPSTRVLKRKALHDSGMPCSVSSTKNSRVCSPPTTNAEAVLVSTSP